MNPTDIGPALGRLPSGLFVVTFRNGDAEAAMLASWVQQCSFDPPMLSLAIKRGRDVADWLSDGCPFIVHLLAEGQKDLLSHFGKGLPLADLPDAERRVERPSDRPAVLPEALAVLHCEAAGKFSAGDHHLVLGRIVAGTLRGDHRP